MKQKKYFLTVIIAIVLIILIQTGKFILGRSKPISPLKIENPKVKGDPGAPIQIIEYSDLQCPACGNAAVTLKQYMDKNPTQIYLEFKHYPIMEIHRFALKAAIYTECGAKQNKFWPFYDLLILRRDKWDQALSVDWRFEEMGKEVGLDLKKLQACVNDPKIKSAILEEKYKGKTLGVDATPTFFINGKMVVGPKELNDAIGNFSKKDKL